MPKNSGSNDMKASISLVNVKKEPLNASDVKAFKTEDGVVYLRAWNGFVRFSDRGAIIIWKKSWDELYKERQENASIQCVVLNGDTMKLEVEF